jgi:hypothetical protein
MLAPCIKLKLALSEISFCMGKYEVKADENLPLKTETVRPNAKMKKKKKKKKYT